jgi:hypothetical protein
MRKISLARYISDYIAEEKARNRKIKITEEMIQNAIDAYNGGAR